MKKIYETAEINVLIFAEDEICVASSASVEPDISQDPDDLPIL